MKRAYRMEPGLTRAWAIYTFCDEGYKPEYLFHSAHWNKARAKEMAEGMGKTKIVKIHFEIAE